MNKYFVCKDGVIWTVYDDVRSNHTSDIKIVGNKVQLLGEYDGKPGPETPRLIVDEFVLWHSLVALSYTIEKISGAESFSLDDIRADVKGQLEIPDDLDWDYFVETAVRAKHQADKENRNMTPSRKD